MMPAGAPAAMLGPHTDACERRGLARRRSRWWRDVRRHCRKALRSRSRTARETAHPRRRDRVEHGSRRPRVTCPDAPARIAVAACRTYDTSSPPRAACARSAGSSRSPSRGAPPSTSVSRHAIGQTCADCQKNGATIRSRSCTSRCSIICGSLHVDVAEHQAEILLIPRSAQRVTATRDLGASTRLRAPETTSGPDAESYTSAGWIAPPSSTPPPSLRLAAAISLPTPLREPWTVHRVNGSDRVGAGRALGQQPRRA
jgi:hypothetical protein